VSDRALDFIHVFEPADGPDAITLLLFHGTGGNETSLLDLAQRLRPGAALLSPRGKVLENGSPRFFRRLAEGVFDQEDLRRRTEEMAEFIRAASLAHGFDAGKVVAVGYSNGANIAGSLLLTDPGLLMAAALLHPMVPFEPETPPRLEGKPIFIGAGRRDPLIPADNTDRLEQILLAAGADVSIHWTDGGHELTRDELDAAAEWMRRL
jgi:phospholipase/carboxylesterase